MRRSTSILTTVLLSFALTLPTAVASWKALGSYEPDTSFDQTDGFMFQEPNTQYVEKVYLNVVPMQRNGEVNPNLALLGSRVLVPGNLGFDAFYGAWVDCNLDGYIGHAETVMMEYRKELLPANTPCPDHTRFSAQTATHNKYNWVSELRWIANPYATGNSYAGFDGDDADEDPDGRDGRVIKDYAGATIWGDFGVPGDTMGREVCPTARPYGTTQRTGALLNWADCFTNHRLWENGNAALSLVGMGFAERDNFDQAGHPLNVNNPAGKDDRNETMVEAWDCRSERQKVNAGEENVATPEVGTTLPVGDDKYYAPVLRVTDAEGNVNLTLYIPNDNPGVKDNVTLVFDEYAPLTPRPVGGLSTDPQGSVAGTYAHLVYDPSATGESDKGTCDETDSSFYGNFESNTVPEKRGAKNRVTLRFTYYEEQRNGPRQDGDPFYGSAVYPGVRSGTAISVEGTHWYSETTAPSELGQTGPTLPQVVRSDTLEFEGGIYWTFYANITAAAVNANGLVLPSSVSGTYGSEFCGSAIGPGQPAKNGFVCDPTLWYLDGNGDRVDGTEFYPVPGHSFQLRDVDCFDGTLVRDLGVRASLADVSNSGPCRDSTTTLR